MTSVVTALIFVLLPMVSPLTVLANVRPVKGKVGAVEKLVPNDVMETDPVVSIFDVPAPTTVSPITLILADEEVSKPIAETVVASHPAQLPNVTRRVLDGGAL